MAIKNFALITYSFEGAGLAKRFQDAIGPGGQVVVGVIQDTADIYLPQEIDAMKQENKNPSDEEGKEERLSMYDGILKKMSAEGLVQFLRDVPDKESWFVFTDMNYCFKYAEMVAEFMPYGNFPTAEHRALEVDRDSAKKFIQENYPGVAKDQHVEFSSAEEAMQFVEDSDDIFVLKGNSVDAPTVVPPTDDVDNAKEILLAALEKNKEIYNAGGLILEVKLDDVIELTPEKIYFDGEPVYTTLDIETKRKYAGDVGGELVGCGTDLVIVTKMKDELNKIAFPKIVDQMAKKAKGMFIWDISLLISNRTGKMYPGEFCANRPGWNAMDTELEGLNVVSFFDDLVNGSNPMEEKTFSSSVRIFNDDLGDDTNEVNIIYPKSIEEHVWLIDAKKKSALVTTAGYLSDVAIITGHGDSFDASVNNVYDSVAKFVLATKRWGYRSKGDYLDGSYQTSIINRFNYAVKNKLITGYEQYVPDADRDVVDMQNEHDEEMKKVKKQHRERIKGIRQSIKEILNATD